jgi:nuclear pore complex protein Nup205
LLSDELDLDEIEAAKCLLESQDDPSVLGRSLLECAIIRFHQQRKYTLDALRILLELSSMDDDMEEPGAVEAVKLFVSARLFQSGPRRAKRYVPRCMAAMGKIKIWLQKLADKISAAQALSQVKPDQLSEEMETIEFSRVSLIQQHELLGVVLCRFVERRQAEVSDFMDFVATLKKVDKYDNLLGSYKA